MCTYEFDRMEGGARLYTFIADDGSRHRFVVSEAQVATNGGLGALPDLVAVAAARMAIRHNKGKV